jgi:phospho-N-acetylmuramoyl-pentapeptide-transferase
MLYYLAQLKPLFSPLNIFQYITFRAAGSFLTSLFIALLAGPSLIRWLRAQKPQKIRADTPAQHKAKAGTPAMGGLLIYAAFTAAVLLWSRLTDHWVLLFWCTCSAFFVVGFVDDYLKAVEKRKDGLTPAAKMGAQLLIALGVMTYLHFDPPNAMYATHVSVPFSKEWVVNLGFFFIPFGLAVLIGAANAVNLADGLDGLAAGTLVISVLPYIGFAYLAGHARFSQYLRIIPVAGAGELTVVLSAVVGASLGFLWFNAHPAEVFMGDTGSLFLGAALGMAALCTKQELLLLIVGGIFVAEAGSVLLQVYSFRVHKRRIFKMAPLHHHFEMIGWPESKVTIRFWIVAVILALVALSSLKLR